MTVISFPRGWILKLSSIKVSCSEFRSLKSPEKLSSPSQPSSRRLLHLQTLLLVLAVADNLSEVTARSTPRGPTSVCRGQFKTSTNYTEKHLSCNRNSLLPSWVSVTRSLGGFSSTGAHRRVIQQLGPPGKCTATVTRRGFSPVDGPVGHSKGDLRVCRRSPEPRFIS